MKKVMAMILALFFVTSTSGLIWAQGTAAPSTIKNTKHNHKKHHSKKKENSASSPATAPSK